MTLRQFQGSNGEFIFHFESQKEMDDITTPLPERENHYRREFVGRDLQTWEDVQSAAQSNWTHGQAVLERFLYRLKDIEIPKMLGVTRKTRYDSEGEEIDFEKMMEGYMNFWRKTTREKSEGERTATVVIDTSTSANVDSDNILWRGAAAIAISIILEDVGYQVEIIAINGCTLFFESQPPAVIACTLKQHGDPLDRSTLINVVSGWFYRTANFALLETIAIAIGLPMDPSYGMPLTFSQVLLDEIIDDQQRIFSSGVFTFDGAASLMESELKPYAKGIGNDE